MAGTPQWKVYLNGEYIAATKHPEDAAALAAISGTGIVKHDHKLVVWTEGAEEFSAGESYDRAAQIMRTRRDEYMKAATARREGRFDVLKKELAKPRSFTLGKRKD